MVKLEFGCLFCDARWKGDQLSHSYGACAQRQIANAVAPLHAENAELKRRVEALEREVKGMFDDGK
jgi:cell division protein FtsB